MPLIDDGYARISSITAVEVSSLKDSSLGVYAGLKDQLVFDQSEDLLVPSILWGTLVSE